MLDLIPSKPLFLSRARLRPWVGLAVVESPFSQASLGQIICCVEPRLTSHTLHHTGEAVKPCPSRSRADLLRLLAAQVSFH